jgi:hypothetical protein
MDIRYDGVVSTGFIYLKIGMNGGEGFSEHDNEPSGCIKFWEIRTIYAEYMIE